MLLQRRFLNDQGGATAIEYAFIATLIAVAIIAGTTFLGSRLGDAYAGVVDAFAVSAP